jgi:hypothetical protein
MWTLAALHHYLQWIMGWRDTHAHEFQVGAGVVAPEWWIHEVGLDSDASAYRDERRVKGSSWISSAIAATNGMKKWSAGSAESATRRGST